MNILFELPHDRLTGVNTFTYTLAEHMHKLGFIVSFFLVNKETDNDLFLSEILKFGRLDSFERVSKSKYDFIVMCSSFCVDGFKNIKSNKIFIGHGLHSLSYFPNLNYINEWYYISEFGAKYLSNKFNFNVKYLPNFINIDRFNSIRPLSNQLKKILLLDSRVGHLYSKNFEIVANKNNILFDCLSLQATPNLIWDVANKINEYDLIIGYGRSAYEAMSCGRNVLIYGINGGDGMLIDRTRVNSMYRNCSGWGIRSMVTPDNLSLDDIELEFTQYDSNVGEMNRNTIINKLDINLIDKFDIFKSQYI